MKYKIEALLITALVFAACSKSSDEKKTSDAAPNLEIVNSVAQMPNTRDGITNETIPVQTKAPPTKAEAKNNGPEKALITAMTIAGENETLRQTDSGPAIQQFMKAGIIANKPDIRMDYSDMYSVLKPYKFMGHELVEIQEEYMTKYIGCCVDESVRVILKSNGNLDEIKKFATSNQCALNEKHEIAADAQYLKGLKIDKGAQYVSLSCRNGSNK